MKTLEQWLLENADFATMVFKERGELMAMWVAETRKGEIIPIAVPLTDKEATIRAIRQLFKERDAVRYIFMTEAWTIAAKPGKDSDEAQAYAERRSLKDHPDRREVIMISAEDKAERIMGQMFILRPEHGKPTVSKFEILTRELEGRFTGLLPA